METQIEIHVDEPARSLGLEHRNRSEQRVERSLSHMFQTDVKAAVRYNGSIDSGGTKLILWFDTSPGQYEPLASSLGFDTKLQRAVSHYAGVPETAVEVDVIEDQQF